MGGKASKVRKQLLRGDQPAVLHSLRKQTEVRRLLDPNLPSAQLHGLTPLQTAARASLDAVLRLLLSDDLGGNPNKTTPDGQTCLHLVCAADGPRCEERRLHCLRLLLHWRGLELDDEDGARSRESLSKDARDSRQNTALHLAAERGLADVVTELVAAGVDASLENEAKETAADKAAAAGFTPIAELLEAHTLFPSLAQPTGEAPPEAPEQDEPNSWTGLTERELMESKDQLLVETSDMLQVPLFTAEALLKSHQWCRSTLWTAWNKDRRSCCEKSGVRDPEVPASPASPGEPSTQLCGICAAEKTGREMRSAGCGHGFCGECWRSYVGGKVGAGDVAELACPEWGCGELVGGELVEAVSSPKTARRFLALDLAAFVWSHPSLRPCPFPGCGSAVRLGPEEGTRGQSLLAAVFPLLPAPPPSSRAVECPAGHVFCPECQAWPSHEPSSCERWAQWQAKMAAVRPEELPDTAAASEAAANCLWLVSHSKPCPKCRSPIQKNEGCNHIKCSKCKQDFCWVCLGPWKRHNSETGGYFRCNRYDETKKSELRTDSAIAKAKEESHKAQELNRFVHYYARFRNHLNSQTLEMGLRKDLGRKLERLAREARLPLDDLAFVTKALDELILSRRVLSSSYVYGYFLHDSGYSKTIFEYLQNELEVSVESLSGLVGRSFIRGSQGQIKHTWSLVGSRRRRFLLCISRGLVPPETPPGSRRSRHHLPTILGLDLEEEEGLWSPDQLAQLDPAQPWVKDRRGRHHNLSALLDWPAEEEAEGAEAAPSPDLQCHRPDCRRPRALNPRTKTLQDFCSLRCQYANRSQPAQPVLNAREYNVDLMIALQMSKLQLMEDLGWPWAGSGVRVGVSVEEEWAGEVGEARAGPSTAGPGSGGRDWEAEEETEVSVQLAIERSVTDVSWARETLGRGREAQTLLRSLAKDSDDPASAANLRTDLLPDKDSHKTLLPRPSKNL